MSKQKDWTDILRSALDTRAKSESIYAIAKKCKISQTALRAFHNGSRPDLRLSSAQRIARELGVTLG